MKKINNNYDVIISGTGLAGSIYGIILAKNGLKVLLIEKGQHPRFAIGEAMLPQSALWPFIIGQYYDIPEIQHLGHTDQILEHMGHSCGIKHSIGFGYHEKGQEIQQDHVHQLIPPHMPFYSESHLMRAEVDHYLVKTAQKYGCDYIDNSEITNINIANGLVEVTANQVHYSSKFYIDSSGKNSLLAKNLNYRTGPQELKTNSRTIFAHFEQVEEFDSLVSDSINLGQTKKLNDGTIHHVFNGGWFWVIPFGNYNKSKSTITSVGLTLNRNLYPVDKNISPEEEFFSFVEKYPTIKKHLGGIKNITNIVRSERLQFSSNKGIGDHFFFANNTYGFIDPLYSNGMVHTFESIFLGSKLLIEAFKNNTFGESQFLKLERLHSMQIHDADKLISCAYQAMQSFDTWNGWTQFWLAQVLFHDLWIQRSCFKFFETGDKKYFEDFFTENRPGCHAPFYESKVKLLNNIQTILNSSDETSIKSQQILDLLKSIEWLPKHVYNWGDKNERNVDFANLQKAQELLGWGFQNSPTELRKNLFDFKLPV